MKKIKFKDKAFLPMLILFILIGFVISITGCIEYKDNQKSLIDYHNQLIEDCNKTKDEDKSEEDLKLCNNLRSSDLSQYDTNSADAYEGFIFEKLRTYLNEFIIIAIVVIGSSYYITKYLRNRIIINDMIRENYKIIIKKLFMSTWKYALLIPIMLCITFMIIFIFFKQFQVSSDITAFYRFEETIFENNLILYFIVILVQSFLLSLIYTNINLIVSRKEHNYILSVIKTYLLIVGIEIFFEAVITNLLYKFNSGFGHNLNIINIYSYSPSSDGMIHMFVLLGILAVSFIPLFLSYKNKEKLIIDCEKNDNKEEV